MFRVSQGGEGIDDADTIEGAREIVRGQPTDRYDVDENRADPFPSGHTSRLWGRMIRPPDGRVEAVRDRHRDKMDDRLARPKVLPPVRPSGSTG
jgi:hypothetical protein